MGNLGNNALKIIFLLFSLVAFGSKQASADDFSNDSGKSISFVRKSDVAKPVTSAPVKSNPVKSNKAKNVKMASSDAAGTGASVAYKKSEQQVINSPLDLLKKQKAERKQAANNYSPPKNVKNTKAISPQNDDDLAFTVKAASKANKYAIAPNSAPKTAQKADAAPKPVVKMASVEKKSTNLRETGKPKSYDTVSYVSEAQMMRELGMDQMADNNDKASVRPQDVAEYQKVGAPYQVNGKWYIPAHEPEYDETGIASWYGNDFHGKKTADGEMFDMNEVTVAHPTLPMPSLVEVTNLDNGRTIIARVNDRGPFASNRLIDVSKRAAELLGFKDKGTAHVRVKYAGIAPQINDSIGNNKVMMAQNNAPKPAAKAVTKAVIAPVQENDDLSFNVAQYDTPKAVAKSAPKAISAPVKLVKNNNEAKTVLAVNTSKNLNYVQIGAFASRANADKLANASKVRGDVKITEAANANGVILYRVMLAENNLQANNQILGKKSLYASAD